MSNPSKVAGTKQETKICNIINDYVGDIVARRVALKGNYDEGDIRIDLGTLVLTGESKYSKTYPSQGELEEFKRQTVTENDNARQDGGLLFVNVPRRSADRMEVWLQRSTHFKLELYRLGLTYPNDIPLSEIGWVSEVMRDSETSWRRVTLFDFLHEYFGHPAWEGGNNG